MCASALATAPGWSRSGRIAPRGWSERRCWRARSGLVMVPRAAVVSAIADCVVSQLPAYTSIIEPVRSLPMTDPKQQRMAMVESQVRPSDVTDRRIIRAMQEIPREQFAPETVRAIAYMDAALPVTPRRAARQGRYLLPPRTLAKLLQAADIAPDSLVLDVGCATGYSSAVLAQLARAVVALEVDSALAEQAEVALRAHGVLNVVVLQGPLAAGAPTHAPFDVILLNGSVAHAPTHLLAQLKERGRLVGVLAEGGFGGAQVWRRAGKSFDAVRAFDASAEPLPGFAQPVEFTL
jgi:protein-L-isoaspartate(D-aspartate) O-methyltransferase